MPAISQRVSDTRAKIGSLRDQVGEIAILWGFQAVLALLLLLGWDDGISRALIVGLVLFGLVVVCAPQCSDGASAGGRPLQRWINVLLLVGIAGNIGMASFTAYRCMRSHHIPLDQGQATWRAARLLWLGENPYGIGAAVDFSDLAREPRERVAADLLHRYDETLDPELRQRILPVPVRTGTSGTALELYLGGYKYGPVIIYIAAPFAPLGSPVVVILLSAFACFGLFWAVWRLLLMTAGDLRLAALGMIAVLFDRHISGNYLNATATDVWPLLFDALAVLAYFAKRPYATALALALAVGSKLFPSLLIVPLLLRFRWPGPIAVFIAAVLVPLLPWLVWDPMGLVNNVVLWPGLVQADGTSWLTSFPLPAASACRGVIAISIAILWWRYLWGRETRLFYTLALVNGLILLGGKAFHNNYVPWCSIWLVLAIIEALAADDHPLRRFSGRDLSLYGRRWLLRTP